MTRDEPTPDSTSGHRVAGTDEFALRRIEDRIERAEYQLGSMRKVRGTALFGGIPFLTLMAAALVPVLDISLLDAASLIPSSVMVAVLGGTAALGLGAHRGVRRAEQRLDDLENERAHHVGRVARAPELSSPASPEPFQEDDAP